VFGVTPPPTPGSGSSSSEGEYLLGSAKGRYDAEWVASAARQKDPGLPEETARELSVYAWDHLRSVGELDAPEIARRLLADHARAGATAANVVATAAVDFCRKHDIALT
jgi:hypothetical protein